MVCISRNLSVHAYSNGFTFWNYDARRQTLDTICAANYFDNVADMLTANDTIIIVASDGVRMVYVKSADSDAAVVEPLR